MRNDLLFEWLKMGNVTIPNAVLAHYKALGLTNDDLITLIQLLSITENGQHFPDSQVLANRLNVSPEEAYKAIHQLMTKKMITLETQSDEEGKTTDHLSFDLLYEKILKLMSVQENEERNIQTEISSKELYSLFEQEFGRGLSAIEIQTLDMWLNEDKHSPELIQMALREAVLNQVYSLKYIDRILLSWEKKNIRTKEQVEKEAKRRRSQQSKQSFDSESDPNEKPVPMYNWLKNKFEND